MSCITDSFKEDRFGRVNWHSDLWIWEFIGCTSLYCLAIFRRFVFHVQFAWCILFVKWSKGHGIIAGWKTLWFLVRVPLIFLSFPAWWFMFLVISFGKILRELCSSLSNHQFTHYIHWPSHQVCSCLPSIWLIISWYTHLFLRFLLLKLLSFILTLLRPLLLLTYFRKIYSCCSYLQLIGEGFIADGSNQIFTLHMTLISFKTLPFRLSLELAFSSQCKTQQFHDAILMMHFFQLIVNSLFWQVNFLIFHCFQSISQRVLPILCSSWSTNQSLR